MSTYEWHTMAYKYIRVTYGWHKSTYEWHTITYKRHADDEYMMMSTYR